MDAIFDVGANVGQTAARFQQAFPTASIHCFELVQAALEKLQAASAGDPKDFCHRLTDNSVTSTLHYPAHYLHEERVIVTTIDDFSRQQGINPIDLFEIDAAAHDLEALQGATFMLAAGRLAMVLSKVEFTPGAIAMRSSMTSGRCWSRPFLPAGNLWTAARMVGREEAEFRERGVYARTYISRPPGSP